MSGAPEIINRIDHTPLTLLKNAQWLPQSYMNSDGFWRRFSDRVLDGANVVIVRRNHDAVVGTRLGLAVLRRGYWEWFALDPIRGRFSNNVSRAEATPRYEILALAEDTTGRLWWGRLTVCSVLKASTIRNQSAGRRRKTGCPVRACNGWLRSTAPL